MSDRNRNNDMRLSLADLTEKAGVSVRTVRYYIAEGLLPPPNGSGPASFYTPAHLERLRLIGRLKDAYLPLKEIRRRLNGVEDAELPALLALSEAELFDPATWERRGGSAPRTVSSYVERAVRESRSRGTSPAYRASPAPSKVPPVRKSLDWSDGHLMEGGLLPEGDFEEAVDFGVIPAERVYDFAEYDEVAEKQEGEPGWLAQAAMPSALPPERMSRERLQDVSAGRPEIERAAGPAWRRVSLGEEIELMVSDRAWRRNREKLEWLANWARKVLR